MLGAPHTTRTLAVAEVDVGEPDAVGVGMRDHVEDPGDDDAVRSSRPGSSIASTSRPSWFSASAMSSTATSSSGVNSRIHDSGARKTGPQN